MNVENPALKWIGIAFAVATTVIGAYAYLSETRSVLTGYIAEDRQLNETWLDADIGEHSEMQKSQKEAAVERINIRRDIANLYRIMDEVNLTVIYISQDGLKELREENRLINQNVNEVRVECAKRK